MVLDEYVVLHGFYIIYSILLSWNLNIVFVEMISFPSWLFFIIPLRSLPGVKGLV